MPIYPDKARGRLVFEFDRYIAGQRIRARHLLPQGWSRAQADAFERRESARLYALASGVSAPRHTIGQAVARYLAEHAPGLKHAKNLGIELRALREWYDGRPMHDLPAVCAEYLAAQRAHLAPATIRNRIAYLRAACRWAWKHHGMAESDPGARIVSPAVSNGRQVYIDRRQMLALARACPHRGVRAMIRIAWYSGMRLGEIERARPDFAAGVLVLDDTKNGEARHVPIHPRLRVCLTLQPWPSRYTFGYWFRHARVAAGLPKLHAHDLRHSAASELIRVGVDLYTVGAILGHKSAASTKRYAHLGTAQARAAIHKMGKKSPDTPDANSRPKAAVS